MEELQKLISEIRTPNSNRTTQDIYGLIDDHRVWVETDFYNFVKNFQDFFEELNTIVGRLNFVKKDGWHKHNGSQYLFYPDALKTLHRAFEDTLDGYYDEAMMLIRSVYETFLRIVFISCYPQEWDAVYMNRKSKMNFEVTGFVKDHLKLDWEFMYRLMSRVSHSKTHSYLKEVIKRAQAPSKDLVCLQYKPSPKMIWMPINGICFVQSCLYHVLLVLFEKDFPGDKMLAPRLDRILKIDRALLLIIKGNDQNKFGELANGIIKIGKIIKAAESGKDWKSLA